MKIPLLKPKKDIFWCPSCKSEEPVEHKPVLNPKSCPTCKTPMKHMQIREAYHPMYGECEIGIIRPNGERLVGKDNEHHGQVAKRHGFDLENAVAHKGHVRYILTPERTSLEFNHDNYIARKNARGFVKTRHLGGEIETDHYGPHVKGVSSFSFGGDEKGFYNHFDKIDRAETRFRLKHKLPPIGESQYAYRPRGSDTRFGYIDPEGKTIEPQGLESEHHDISRRLGHSDEHETMQRGYTRFLHVPGHELGLTVPDTDKAKAHALEFLRKNHTGENVFISRVFYKLAPKGKGLQQHEKATYHWNPDISQHDPVPEVSRWMKEDYVDSLINRVLEMSDYSDDDPDMPRTLSGKHTRFLTDTSGMSPFSKAHFGWYTHTGENISSKDHGGAGSHGSLADVADRDKKLPHSTRAHEHNTWARALDSGWTRWIEEPNRLYAHVNNSPQGLSIAHKFLSSQQHNKPTMVELENLGLGYDRKDKYNAQEFSNPREAADYIMHKSLGREVHKSAVAQYHEDVEALIDQMLDNGKYIISEGPPDFHNHYTGNDLEALKNKEGRYPRKDSHGHSLIYYTGWSHLCPDCAFAREKADDQPTTMRGAYSLKDGSVTCKDCSRSINVIKREPLPHEHDKWLKPLPGKPKPVVSK